ncbi:hypothetical protein B0E51_04310 [Rhodanobacter sp. C05]|nr:hypothetical protein B0E51_04310 [Rhodanobacter sp. C05]
MPLKQAGECTCWAAAAAMMLSAKYGVPYTELSAADAAGTSYVTRVNAKIPGEQCENQGLPGDEVDAFAKAIGLAVNPINNPTLARWRQMLSKGPVWAGIALQDGNTKWFAHIIVVTSMSNTDGVNPDVTYADPSDGSFHTIMFDRLETVIENVPELWDSKTKLPTQFLYWP